MNMPSGWEWILVILLALFVFGPKRLPELMRALGEGVRDFKKAMNSEPAPKSEKGSDSALPPVESK